MSVVTAIEPPQINKHGNKLSALRMQWHLARERVDRERYLPVWVWHEHLARYRFAAAYVREGVVIDCACGDGSGAGTFAQPCGSIVYAVDISEATVQRAVHECRNDRVRFLVGDAVALPLRDDVCDVFISLETIEHVSKEHEFLREVTRTLKPDGLFICSTPNRLVMNPGKELSSRPCNPYHVREYSTAEFLELLGRYFGGIREFGQNRKAPLLVAVMEHLGRLLPGHLAVRINQVLKLPRLLYDRREHHDVVPSCEGAISEYSVAICRTPRK